MTVRDVNTFASVFPHAALRPLAGATELAIAEAVASPGSRPEKVTRVLNATFETIAGEPVTIESVRQLTCGTREWLLQQAADRFRPDTTWFEAQCVHCGYPYDLSLSLVNSAPRVPDELCSEIEVQTSLGPRTFLAPTGAHEEAFAKGDTCGDPRRIFAALCGRSDDAEEEARQYNEKDLELIDEALEAISPDIADEARTVCAECGEETSARIDPLTFAFPLEDTVFQEAHVIAKAYGWAHDQILQLSARHRGTYAAMVVRDRNSSGRTTSRRPG